MMYNLLCFNGDGVRYREQDYLKLKVLLDDYVKRTPQLRGMRVEPEVIHLPQSDPRHGSPVNASL